MAQQARNDQGSCRIGAYPRRTADDSARGPAIRPALRRRGEIQGGPRPIDRNSAKYPLTWRRGAGFRATWACGRLRRLPQKILTNLGAQRNRQTAGSEAICGGIQGPPPNIGGPRIRRPEGSATQGRDSRGPHPPDRHTSKSPLTLAAREECRTSCVCCRARRNISSKWSGNPDRSRRFPAPPPGRIWGEWARFRGGAARSTEIQRSRHLPGAIGRNFAPHGSVKGGVESPWGPCKSRTPADPPTGRFLGEGSICVGCLTRPA